jgi:hypothetical protein
MFHLFKVCTTTIPNKMRSYTMFLNFPCVVHGPCTSIVRLWSASLCEQKATSSGTLHCNLGTPTELITLGTALFYRDMIICGCSPLIFHFGVVCTTTIPGEGSCRSNSNRVVHSPSTCIGCLRMAPSFKKHTSVSVSSHAKLFAPRGLLAYVIALFWCDIIKVASF